MFYLTTYSTHFIHSYMASDIWLKTIMIARKETCCRHIGYSFQLAARVLLYAPSHRQDSTYHGLCYTSRGALAGMRNSPMGLKKGVDHSSIVLDLVTSGAPRQPSGVHTCLTRGQSEINPCQTATRNFSIKMYPTPI